MRQLKSDEARRDWRDLLDEVQADPDAAVQILRYDKPVAVLVSARWYDATMEFIGAAEDAADIADADAAIDEPGGPIPVDDAAREAEALAALDRLPRGGPWEPGERDALAKTYGDWVTSNPGEADR